MITKQINYQHEKTKTTEKIVKVIHALNFISFGIKIYNIYWETIIFETHTLSIIHLQNAMNDCNFGKINS